ncbi:MAG: ATP-binding cassette domain-containing protein [Candidatus Eisenbacteria bacterium]|nr:ATP-binding cassette domain-containing protein [Candidatus Eisenbacteria bacterium]
MQAVRGVDFAVREQEFVGFLGPNGAGKTTIMRMVGCAIGRTAGALGVLGMDPQHHARWIKQQLGVVPQEDNLDTRLTVLENLLLYGRYHDMESGARRRRAEELLDFFVLSARAHDRVQTLSGGMRRRLLLARGLIHEPRVLLLDEPTTGLDPQARHLIWERLLALKRRGTTLLLTTHYMDEAEQLCDRVLIMEGGRFIAAGAPRELIGRLPGREIVEFTAPRPVRVSLAGEIRTGVEAWEHLEDRSLALTEDADALLRAMPESVHAAGVAVYARRATLEDVFLRLTGRRLSEDEP